jgi:hypothetical protein
LRLGPSLNAAVNLATGKDFVKFVKLMKASAFFEKVCPCYKAIPNIIALGLSPSFTFPLPFVTSYYLGSGK